MKFTIYGTTNCSWCDRAKDLLQHTGHSYAFRDIHRCRMDFDFITVEEGLKTVPQIYVTTDGDCRRIGGYEDLVQFIEEKEA